MIVKILVRSGNAAVVAYRDDKGMTQARVISIHHINGVKNGQQTDIPDDVVLEGIEYGIDWTIVFPEQIISLADLQQSMRNHGIWTEEDMIRKPKEMVSAINALSAAVYVEMINYAKKALGE